VSAEEFELRNRLTVVSITVARVDDCPEAFAEAAPESEAGQFWLLTSGCAVWQSGSRCHLARPGSLVHVPPRFPCHCHAVPGNHFSSLVARYKPGALPRQVSAPLVKLGLMTVTTDLMSEAQSASARSLMEDMLHETQQRHPGWQALVQAQLVQLAVRFQRSAMQSYRVPTPETHRLRRQPVAGRRLRPAPQLEFLPSSKPRPGCGFGGVEPTTIYGAVPPNYQTLLARLP